jgi:purine-binding chemotaxis protein CheW
MLLEPHTPAKDDLELLAFRVADHEFSVDIMKVREIRGWSPATSLQHAPDYVCGVINLRGVVLPVIDLSSRLGMSSTQPTARNVIIVMQVQNRTLGILVDAVSDILTLNRADIIPPPDLADYKGPSFIIGLTIVGDRIVQIVDLSEILPDATAA